MAPSYSSVVLSTSKDYDNWIEIIKTAALKQDIWRFINPDLLAPLEPIEPSRPTLTDVADPIETRVPAPGISRQLRSATVQGESSLSSQEQGTPARTPTPPPPPTILALRPPRFSDLDADQKEYLHVLNQRYESDHRRYLKEREALADIRGKIQETIDPKHLVYTKNDFPHTTLVKLREKFKPSDHAKKLEIRSRWITLQNTNKTPVDTEVWLQQWEICYDECLEQRIPDAEDPWATISFIEALKKVSSGYAENANFNRSNGNTKSFRGRLYKHTEPG